jgi:hypothetical protein
VWPAVNQVIDNIVLLFGDTSLPLLQPSSPKMARMSSQLLSILLLALTSTVFGQSSSISQSPSNTINSFPTITDTEGTGQLGGNVGSTGSGTKQGASGSGSGFTLGAGAIAGIAVACGIVVIGVSKF